VNNIYDKLERDIRETMMINQDFNRGLQLCKKYIKLLAKDEKKEIVKNRLYMANYNIAYNYARIDDINEYKKAVKHLIIAKGCTEENQYDSRYSDVLTLLAICYEALGDKEEAKQMYDKCSTMYGLIGDNSGKTIALFNIARIDIDIKLMKEIKSKFELSSDVDNFNISNEKQQRLIILKDMEVDIKKLQSLM
jgi:tetratricopeptide (TPR) repeat protein